MQLRFFLLLFLFCSTLFAELVLKQDQNIYHNFTLQTYYDAESQLTIDDISTIDFEEITANQFTFGYLAGTRWFKLDLVNSSENEEFVVNFDEALWTQFDLYYQEKGVWKKESNGLAVSLQKRNIKDITPSFLIHIEKNSTKSLYFQARTKASQIGYFKVLSAKEYFSPFYFRTSYIYILFAFTLLTIILLNLYKYILTREVVYFYYIVYTAIFIVFSSMQSGTYMLFGFGGWSEGLHVVGTFVNISLILFTNKLLELQKVLPKTYIFFRNSIGVFFAFSFLIFYGVSYAELLFNLYSVLFFIMLFITAIRVYRKGSTDAKNYLIALMIYTPLMSLMILNFNALLEYSFYSRHIYLLGSFIEIVFFTLILTNRYRELNREKLQIQKELLAEKQKYQSVLEETIEQRTKELQDAQKELQKIAITDKLTQLYNRYKIDEILTKEYERATRFAEPFGIILIDIDNFKLLNDKYGHQVGDATLKAIASAIKKDVRKVDTVGRWGGEEFIIICPKTDLKGSIKLAETIRQSVERLCLIPVKEQSASFGVSGFKAGDTLDTLIKRADDALYKAKKEGKNSVVSY